MSDTDYYRYLRDGVVGGIDYHSLKNAKAGVRYSRSVDKTYTGKWFNEDGTDQYGEHHYYDIQKLTAVLKWVDTPGFLPHDPWSQEPTTVLEWVDVDD